MESAPKNAGWNLNTDVVLSTSRVCSPAIGLLQKKAPHHRRKICVDTLWLYSYFTQTSPSNNINVNYIFVYRHMWHVCTCACICMCVCMSIYIYIYIVAPFPTSWCCSYWKESLRVTLDQLTFYIHIYIQIYIYIYRYTYRYITCTYLHILQN